MKIYENGIYREMAAEEIAAMQAQEAGYWQTVTYNEAVDSEIRKRYSVSQEFAILRQKEEKPAEYAAYFAWCEQCKAFVKGKKGL